MAEVNPPTFLQAGSHPALNVRLGLGALLVPDRDPLSARPGVRPDGLAVTALGTPGNAVQVALGVAFVRGSTITNQGVYICPNDSTEQLAVTPANATNPRIDLVVARVYDAAHAGATNEWQLEVVTGNPAASPVEPAVPASSVVLARIDVPAAAANITNAMITDRRPWSVGLGGVLPCTSTTRPTTGLYEGLVIYERDTDSIKVWTGAAWADPANLIGAQDATMAGKKHFAANYNINATNGQVQTSTTVPFGTTFATVPVITGTPLSGSASALWWRFTSVTTTQFTVLIGKVDGSAFGANAVYVFGVQADG